MAWLRRNWRWLLAVIVSVGGAFFILLLLALKKKTEAKRLQTQLSVMRAVAEVTGLKADKAARREALAQNGVESCRINKALAEAKRKAVAATQDVAEMDDLQIAIRFRELGY